MEDPLNTGLIARFATPTPPAAPRGGATAIHPEAEWWDVGGKRYDSTSDMLRSYQASADGVDATYHFRHETTYTKHDATWDTAAGAMTGAAVGAGAAGLGVAALEILGVVGEIMMLSSRSASLPVLGPVLVLAGVGAAIGGAAARSSAREDFEQGTAVSGKILTNGGRDVFYPGGQLNGGVDLDAYAKSVAPPGSVAVPAEPAWKDALKGAAAGATLPASTLIPLAGPFLPTIAGSHVGSAIDGKRGGVLGAAAGVAATVGTYTALNTVGLAGFGVLTAASAVAGAALGPKALPRMRQAAADDAVTADQWWRPYESGAAR